MGKIIDIRRQMGGKPLQYDAEVEYLSFTLNRGYENKSHQSDGIDLGIIATERVGYEVKTMYVNGHNFTPIGSLSERNPIGCYVNWLFNDNEFYTPRRHGVSRGARLNVPIIHLTRAYTDGSLRKVIKENGITISDETAPRNYSYNIDNVVLGLIGGLCNNATKTVGRFYYAKIYDLDRLIKDIIPVRVGNVVCVYDRVGKQLYYNWGNNPFTAGPDVIGGGGKSLVITLVPVFGERRAA